MRRFIIALTALQFMVLWSLTSVRAQVADSVDVLHYSLELDLSSGHPFHGNAVLTVRLLAPCSNMELDFIGTVDSFLVNGVRPMSNTVGRIPLDGIAVGDTFTVDVAYQSFGYVESYGFGGLHFDNDMTYNLGAAFREPLHSIGHAVFPCRDNYHDKATYTIQMKTKAGWSAECSGILQSRTVDNDGCEHSTWTIDHPVSTYIVGISEANYHRIQDTVAGYPLTIGFTTQDSTTTRNVYALLDAVVPKFEECFGPYRWGRIGYIGTAMGSMEHVNNIALARQAMASVTQDGQSTIAHELGHAWFGNLVTCEEEGDMWINEGGATFTSEVAREATHGRRASNATYQQNLDNVIRTTHHSDGGYRALHGMPHNYTYGSTTYDKGGLVWHSLRGYLGDSLFYASIRTLMERCAFGNIDAYRLRDSLSAYSGVDLTGFFDFHVFSPGFNDYNVCTTTDGSDNTIITIRQSSLGTDSLMRQNRVPVTFFSPDGQRHKEWFAFAGTDTVIHRQLPYATNFHVLDLDCELSDAVTVDSVDVAGGTGTTPAEMAFFAVRLQSPSYYTRYYIEHHYVKAYDIDSVRGVVRPSRRYWVVRGNVYENNGATGRFRFIRQGYSASGFPNLDEGFYSNSSSLDSIALMWRPSPDQPWTMVSQHRVGNANDGNFIAENLRLGEYTLAVVDTALLSIANTPSSTPDTPITLFPNPVHRGEPVAVNIDTDSPFAVTLIDASGRAAWHRNGCRKGEKLTPDVPAGTYTVTIENNNTTLQSKIIIL